jgi:hypothetical protein
VVRDPHTGGGEQSGDREIVSVSRPVQCGHAVGLRCIYIGLLFEKRANGSEVRFFGGISDRGLDGLGVDRPTEERHGQRSDG